jgi:serine/threonine protein kinase
MEYLEGETLAARSARAGTRSRSGGPPTPPVSTPPGAPASGPVRRGAPLPLEETLHIGTELAEALAAAHKAGIIHRDLKPGNVMLTPAGAKVLDFGLARLRAANAAPDASAAATRSLEPLTDAGTRLGTIPHMAPEQVEGKEADARSDVFALGAPHGLQPVNVGGGEPDATRSGGRRAGRGDLVFVERGNLLEIWATTLDSPGEPRRLVGSRFDEWNPAVSSDGRWLAYA